jgi:hypothetical protein
MRVDEIAQANRKTNGPAVTIAGNMRGAMSKGNARHSLARST